jgi:hypothetical protein
MVEAVKNDRGAYFGTAKEKPSGLPTAVESAPREGGYPRRERDLLLRAPRSVGG